jgi:N-acetyl-alpha-D-muramate 1-phosphate uridylyltransferase
MTRAMILAAGFGTRLGTLTAETPKCLMPVGSKTMLEHVIDNLKRAGVDSIIINRHYLAGKVESFIQEKNNFGIEILLTYEPIILGTGGGIKNARQYLEGEKSFIVHNADVYSDLDLRALMQAHEASGAAATLAIMDRKTSRPLLFNQKNCLVGWESTDNQKGELIPGEGQIKRFAFSGIQVISPELFPYMDSEAEAFSIIRTYVAAARAGSCIRGFRMDSAYWIDVGRPEHLEELRRKLS